MHAGNTLTGVTFQGHIITGMASYAGESEARKPFIKVEISDDMLNFDAEPVVLHRG